MHKADIVAIVSTIAAACALGTDAAFGQNLATLFGPSAPKILAAVALIGLVATTISRVLGSPSTPAASAAPATSQTTVTIAPAAIAPAPAPQPENTSAEGPTS